MSNLLVRAARGERTERPPVWLMRQAGRYIPEYREIRQDYTFKEAISTPEVAERISLLPWDIFQPDGIVMYSDILTVLEPLGLDYHLESGVGPVIEDPIDGPTDVPAGHRPVEEDLDYVGALLERLQDRIGDRAAVIGFAGGPFTLASYAVAGKPAKNHTPLRRLRASDPDTFEKVLDAFTEVTIDYLQYQERAGADVVQLFDTYAGFLTRADHEEFLLPRHRRILDAVDVPTIVFVRDAGGRLDLLERTGADVVSLGWTVDVADAREKLDTAVQGNLDPSYLLGSEAFVREKTAEVIEAAGPKGHVLNLGHGIGRDTPVENATAFVETAKQWVWDDQ